VPPNPQRASGGKSNVRQVGVLIKRETRSGIGSISETTSVVEILLLQLLQLLQLLGMIYVAGEEDLLKEYIFCDSWTRGLME